MGERENGHFNHKSDALSRCGDRARIFHHHNYANDNRVVESFQWLFAQFSIHRAKNQAIRLGIKKNL